MHFKLLEPIIMREFILSIEKQIPPDSLYDLKSAAGMPSYSENQSSRTVWGGGEEEEGGIRTVNLPLIVRRNTT